MGYGMLNDERGPPGPSQNFGEGAVDGSQASRSDLNSSAALFVPTPMRESTPMTSAWPSISSCMNMDGVYQPDSRVSNNLMSGVPRHSYLLSPQFDPGSWTNRGSLRSVDSVLQDGVGRGSSMVIQSNTADQRNDQTEGNVDGSFLTLGIGSNPEIRSKRRFDPRHIASRLEEAACTKIDNLHSQPAENAFPNSSNDFSSINRNLESRSIMKFNHREIASKLEENVGHNSSPHLMTSVYPNYTNDFSTVSSSNPISLVEPVSNAGSWAMCDEFMQDSPVNPYSEPFKQPASFENHYRPIGLDTSIRKQSVSQSCTHSQGGLPTLQVKDAYSYQTLPGFRASETPWRAWIPSQPSGDALRTPHSRNTGDVSASFVSNSSKAVGSSVTKDYLGQLSSTVGAYSVDAYPTVASNADKTPAGASFPRRLGVQFHDATVTTTAATQSSIQGYAPIQNRGNLYQSQNPRPPPQAAQYHGPFPGNQQAHFPVQSNMQTPATLTGQAHLAIRDADGPSRVHNSGDQQLLKRKATEFPAVPSMGQRRRFLTVPHYAKPYIPTASSTVAQIKWTGFDEPTISEPRGHRCLICKLDLVYAPERMPPVATNPPVAILPCGHTFHDHCLQLITPDNDKHDPPCIPCALGET